MEFANRLVAAATKAANNNTVISVCLVGSFLALAARSMNQQKNIDALEAEKDLLVKSNKAMKKTLWDWKQQLFSEAETDSALVPLARLRAIYGEAPPPQTVASIAGHWIAYESRWDKFLTLASIRIKI